MEEDSFLQSTRLISPIMRRDSPSRLTLSGTLGESSRGTVYESGIDVTMTPSSILPDQLGTLSGTKRSRSSLESAAVSRADSLSQELDEARIELERTRAKHELAMEAKDAEILKLKQRLKATMSEEHDARTKLEAITDECLELRHAHQTMRAELDAALRTAQEETVEWQERAQELETERDHMAAEANSVIEALRDELDEANAKLPRDEDDKPSPAVASTIRLLRQQLDEQTIQANYARKALEDAQQTLDDAAEVRDLRRKVAELEKAASRDHEEMRALRLDAKNQNILTEQITTLQRALAASTKQASEKSEVHIAYEELANNERTWKELFQPLLADPKNGVDPALVASNPVKAVCELFVARQLDFEALLQQRGQLELQMSKLTGRLEAATKDALAWEAKAAQREAELSDTKFNLETEVRAGLRLRETNADLAALVESYERGETSEARDLVAQLKAALARSEAEVAELQTQARSMASPALVDKHKGRIAQLEAALADAKAEGLRLGKHIEKLETDVAVYEKRLGRGEFNPRTTKVVHMMLNPTSHHVAAPESEEIQALREENERLKDALQQVTHQTPRTKAPAPPPSSITTPHETVEGLRVLNQRLKEVFRDQINRYRDAVYRVTGYKIDLKQNELSLRSMYAENEGDELKFRIVDTENMALIQTDFSASLDPKWFGYLSHCHSPPAFVSSITVSLFEKQTFQ
ncbi:mitotic spindle assembly checkpoint protein MAD1 [Achlya hypogyna]|uniref:Mitotic spindle assembly checkpoint protein MAD1 n=1 Tax=Achlya hypogyna TaxID=1202772 RepID=A0A1V9ZK05_ACHHY|nr:mitotic spindle assembly checkpoint protein MAD1 [Achlya hypogyna]